MISCVSGTVEGRLQSLQRMVESVRESVGSCEYEIILVACECSARTLAWIRAQQDCVLVVRPRREGSVIAFNDGFSRARGEYVVTLNDDIKVDGETLSIAATYLDEHPEVGQVAFGHRYQNRNGKHNEPRLQYAYKYLYGQCCMTRRWLGELAHWWGDYGLKHYGGDTHLSLAIWQLGMRVVGVPSCSVTDWEIEDDTRARFADRPRANNGGVHPDLVKFQEYWKDRITPKERWRPLPSSWILHKAAAGTLRTLRFKSAMGSGYPMRTALIEAFKAYGPATQANQTWAMEHFGGRETPAAQQWFIDVVDKFQPDLVMLQGQRPNNITPETVARMRQRFPDTYIFNWDADTHYPMLDFHWQIAKECNLQLTVSPSLFQWYYEHGAPNIGYWPIGVEHEFINVDRYKYFEEARSCDVIFLGSLYGEDFFPEALTRRDAVLALHKDPSTRLIVHGTGWVKVGLKVKRTLEEFDKNPILYSKSKMALSISQTKDLWGYTSDRCYNILATGCPILIQRFLGIEAHGLIDGQTCIAWSNFKEMLEKVRYYKAHPQEREAIGRAGKELLLARHTWERRVPELFGLIAGMGGEYARA